MAMGLAIGFYGLFMSGCAPVFSELQSARTAGKGQVELTAGYATVNNGEYRDGEFIMASEKVQEQIGLQAAYGITEDLDMRVRFEHITVADDGGNVNVLGFGPKYEIVDNIFSVYVPVGFAFGGDFQGKIEDTWEIHPTLLATVPFNKYIELNTSSKFIHAFHKDGWNYMAFNAGLGLSTDLDKYVVRPEYGWAWCTNDNNSDKFRQFSIGVTIYPNMFGSIGTKTVNRK